jgi:hypothetical protein
MTEYNLKILIIGLALLTMNSCGLKSTKNEMKWLTTETKYEGFPLYLRCPDYSNVWSYSDKFPNLFCITHKLDKVKDNGLPESDYNWSLMDFDGELVDIFDSENEGVIVLIETFGGERNYWYYIKSQVDYKSKIDRIQKKYVSNKIESHFQDDKDWGFLKKYPIKLYERK